MAEKKSTAQSHPPYAALIKDAILSLKERNGSSLQAITKVVGEKHPALPGPWKKLLSNHVRKLKVASKLVQVKGSYKLSEDFKKGPTKPKKVAKKSAAATPKKVTKPKSAKAKAPTAKKPKMAKKPAAPKADTASVPAVAKPAAAKPAKKAAATKEAAAPKKAMKPKVAAKKPKTVRKAGAPKPKKEFSNFVEDAGLGNTHLVQLVKRCEGKGFSEILVKAIYIVKAVSNEQKTQKRKQQSQGPSNKTQAADYDWRQHANKWVAAPMGKAAAPKAKKTIKKKAASKKATPATKA